MSQESLESRRPDDYVQRFFGGPPLAVVGRLVLLSILVGVILAAIGLDPWNILEFGAPAHRARLEYGLRRRTLAVAVFPARGGDRRADLAPGTIGQGAPRPLAAWPRGGASATPRTMRTRNPLDALCGYSFDRIRVGLRRAIFGGDGLSDHSRADRRRDAADAAGATEIGPATRHSRSAHCRRLGHSRLGRVAVRSAAEADRR